MIFVKIFIAIPWLLFGLFLWIPFVIRIMLIYFASIVASTYSNGKIKPAERALRHAVWFYFDGFSHIFSEPTTGADENAFDSWDWGALLKELVFATIFLASSLYFCLYEFAGFRSWLGTYGIELEWMARQVAEESGQKATLEKTKAEDELAENTRLHLADIEKLKKDINDSVIAQNESKENLETTLAQLRDAEAKLQLEKTAHQEVENKLEQAVAMNLQTEKKRGDTQTQFDPAINSSKVFPPAAPPIAEAPRNVEQTKVSKSDAGALSEAPPIRTYHFNGYGDDDTLNVRVGPGTQCAYLASIQKGTYGIEIIGDSKWIRGEKWVKIHAETVTGWVNYGYLLRD